MALLIWARCKTRILTSLHFSLWPLPLSAAPCLGKMRVSSARWRVPWLSWGGGDCFCCFAFCLITTSVHIPQGLDPDVGPVVWELGTAENEYPSPVQFSCALLVQTLVVPRLNFCLRLQCLGSFPVFARPPTH